MILVTGAAGQTGLALLRALAGHGAPARALVSRASSIDRVRAAGAAEAVVGDLRVASDVRRAIAGCRRVYHICPVMSDAELQIGRVLIDAAIDAGIEHFAFHSLVHSQCDGLPHHRDKRLVEERLIESPLPYTVLRPAMYMQNLLRDWDAIVGAGVYRLPYSEHARMSLVDVEDVAQAAAAVLTTEDWIGGEFELCSGDRLTRVEMAQVLSEVLGRPVRAETYPIEAWRPIGAQTRTPFQVERVATMFAHYDRFGLSGGNARVLAMILGRTPTTFRRFVEREAAARGALGDGVAGRGDR